MGRVREAPEWTRRVCRRVARSNSCGSTGENAEGAKQAAPTAEGCSAQTATADRYASSKETADPRFHRGGEAGRHRGAIRAVSAHAEVAGPKHRHPDVFHAKIGHRIAGLPRER